MVALHLLQPGYEPAHQLMSELALGRYGWAMIVALSGLALAVFGILAGGVFPLGFASEIHIAAMPFCQPGWRWWVGDCGERRICQRKGSHAFLAYGATAQEALAKAQALALRVLAERPEHNETGPQPISIGIAAA